MGPLAAIFAIGIPLGMSAFALGAGLTWYVTIDPDDPGQRPRKKEVKR
jgi:hypothetical protein